MVHTIRACRGMTARLVIAALIVTGCSTNQSAQRQSSDTPVSLRAVGEVSLPGDNSRFDYAGRDPQRGWPLIAHLRASEVVEVDMHAGRVVRTIPNISRVHGGVDRAPTAATTQTGPALDGHHLMLLEREPA